MHKNRVTKLAILAIAAAYSQALAPANADEYVETRRTTTVESQSQPADSTSSTTTTTTTTKRTDSTNSGAILTVVPLSLSDSQTVLQTIDLRRSEIDKKIVEARSAGTLSESKSADLRRELDRAGAEIAELKSQSNPSLARSLSLAQDLDVLAHQVRTVYTTYTFVPIIEGSHFTIFNGHILELDDLAVRRIGLENKILDRLASGKISYQQSMELRSDLNAIAAREDICRSNRVNGRLSDKEAREIYKAFDKVAVKLDSYSHTT